MDIKITENRVQGDQKDKVAVCGKALLQSLAELNARSDNPVFVVSSSDLPPSTRYSEKLQSLK